MTLASRLLHRARLLALFGSAVLVSGCSKKVTPPPPPPAPARSEEHTSELQSHSDLVCRLLLEKKKKNKNKKPKTEISKHKQNTRLNRPVAHEHTTHNHM